MQHVQAFLSSLEVGPPAGPPELTLYPLLAAFDDAPGYDTLKDAIAAGHVRVTEVSQAGSVPDLRVVNDGLRPVLVVDGEELVGAKQNRIVNISIMVPAASALTIPVSCVEAGRWHFESAAFSSADRTLHTAARRDKVSQVTASLRASASRRADQGAIWAEIDAKSARMGATSSTRAAAAMYEKAKAALDAFTGVLQPLERQVGAIFAIRGSIVGVDAFDSPATWAGAMPGLVRSYGLDALDAAVGGQAFGAPDPRAFLTAIQEAPVQAFPAVGLGSDLRINGGAVIGGALVVADCVVHVLAFPAHDAGGPDIPPRWARQ